MELFRLELLVINVFAGIWKKNPIARTFYALFAVVQQPEIPSKFLPLCQQMRRVAAVGMQLITAMNIFFLSYNLKPLKAYVTDLVKADNYINFKFSLF